MTVGLCHLDLPELLLSNNYVLPLGSKPCTINEVPVESISFLNSSAN